MFQASESSGNNDSTDVKDGLAGRGSKADLPILLSVDEVASLVRVSRRTVWRLVSSGELIKPVRLRGSTRWRRTELEAWIEAGCPPAHQERDRT